MRDGSIFASARQKFRAGPNGLFVSFDLGQSWFRQTELCVHVLPGVSAADPLLGRSCYFGSFGVRRSDDQGVSWRSLLSGYIRDVVVVPGSARILALFSDGPLSWLYVSSDGGDSWDSGRSVPFGRFALAPGAPDTIFGANGSYLLDEARLLTGTISGEDFPYLGEQGLAPYSLVSNIIVASDARESLYVVYTDYGERSTRLFRFSGRHERCRLLGRCE